MSNGDSSPVLTNVAISASGGSIENRGMANNTHSSPSLTNVTVNASGGSFENYGVCNYSSSATINNSTLRANGGTYKNYGLYNSAASGTYTVSVNNSQVAGSTNTIYNDTEFTTRVGATLLDGGVITSTGTITCAGVYDENYAFYANTCP